MRYDEIFVDHNSLEFIQVQFHCKFLFVLVQ